MDFIFDGMALRLARLFNGYSLEEVAVKVEKTRQYLHKLETGQGTPTPQLLRNLAEVLNVESAFFARKRNHLDESQFHFRKLMTARPTVKQAALARGEMTVALIRFLDDELHLPVVNIPHIDTVNSSETVEQAAEFCRKFWGLGYGPISNMTRLVENLGIVVTTFEGISKEIDALSVAVERPFIVRNTAKTSVCRQRFDIAHELGHLVMHEGVLTGCRITESQANRFASALLLPRNMMLKLFPRPHGLRLDWKGMSQFKLTWKVSKAALLYRARQLDIITESQYKTGVITLRKNGESHAEKEDDRIEQEPPELLANALNLLQQKKHLDLLKVAKAIHVGPRFLKELTGLEINIPSPAHLRLVQ